MKQTVYKKAYLDQPCYPFPNAATRRQILDKLAQTLLALATGAALGVLFLFALALA